MLPHSNPIVRHYAGQCDHGREERQLRLLHPKVLRLLEPILEVDTGEAARNASNGNRRDADDRVLAGWLPHSIGLRHLHQCDTNHQHDQACQLPEGKNPAQQKIAKQCRGQQLGRIGYLVYASVQVCQCDVEQVLLQGEQCGRDGHQQCVAGDDVLGQEPQKALATLALAFFLVLRIPLHNAASEVNHDHDAAQQELRHLVRRYGGGREKHGPVVARPRVAHEHDEGRILEEQAEQAAEPQRAKR
mmetsp:Transcript_1331/g.3520  ORF Transcript_1331/g.3520 Transcript_1331/m.3520 type:complete len:245 (-) Transcript_1331:82-816(-)